MELPTDFLSLGRGSVTCTSWVSLLLLISEDGSCTIVRKFLPSTCNALESSFPPLVMPWVGSHFLISDSSFSILKI